MIKDFKIYYVYIMTNQYHGTLYIGVTGNLIERVAQHKAEVVEGFSKQYHLHRLVYYEQYQQIDDAIRREKQLKNWHRQWKINQIEENNPHWEDLSLDLNMDPETSSG